ncbi:MAG: hypothetical protein JRI96_17160, partial [Deltaproteobacteria bacterium]|nr:hypothetical protein [Deltaproteobacteria bacterium]
NARFREQSLEKFGQAHFDFNELICDALALSIFKDIDPRMYRGYIAEFRQEVPAVAALSSSKKMLYFWFLAKEEESQGQKAALAEELEENLFRRGSVKNSKTLKFNQPEC